MNQSPARCSQLGGTGLLGYGSAMDEFAETAPIPGFGEAYAADRTGAIHSLPRMVKAGGRPMPDGSPRMRHSAGGVMSQYVGRGGYLRVTLATDDGPRGLMVHRLVCAAYHGPPPSAESVCRHLNDNKTDNRPQNLTWGTRLENALDAVTNGRRPTGERHAHARLTDEQAREIRAAYGAGESGPSLAERYGVSAGHIYHVANGTRRTPASRVRTDSL